MPSVYAIGDIHGEYAKLHALLRFLPRTGDDYTVFLGDYIDRGADSAKVVLRVLTEIADAPTRTVALWGNHEDMAAFNFGVPYPSAIRYDPWDWFRNGGTATMASWRIHPPETFNAVCPTELAQLFPHLKRFYKGSDTGIAGMEAYLFVHAGILPGQEPETTDGETLLWVRDEFLNSYNPSGRIVVHGHTPYASVRVHPDKIGIDTAAVRGGVLTCLRLPERVLYQADDNGLVTVSDLSEFPSGAA